MKNNNKKIKAIAKRLNNSPPKNNLPDQKFKRGARVKVCDEMPLYMFHFPSGFEAIIEYSYAQKFWGDDTKNYCLIALDEKSEPINSIAWYHESQLTLVNDNIKKGLEIIEKWNEKGDK